MPPLRVAVSANCWFDASCLMSLYSEHHQAAALLILLEVLTIKQGPNTAAARTVNDGNVLLAIRSSEGSRIAVHSGTDLERPEMFAGFVVDGIEVAFRITVEHQAAPGRQHA